MKKFRFPLLLCLFLLYSLPAAALTSENPADKDWMRAPQEQKNAQDVTLLAAVSPDVTLLAAVSPDEAPTTLVQQTQEAVQGNLFSC